MQQTLADILRKSDNKITFVLLSGGGSDLVGENDLDTLLLKNSGGKEPPDYVHTERLESALQRIETAFWGILGARDTHAPNTVVVTLTYGKAAATGERARPEVSGLPFLALGHHVREILEEREIPEEHRGGILEVLSLRFSEPILRTTSGVQALQQGIVVPTDDTPAEDDRLTETGQVARRIFATVAAKCQGLFGPAEGAGRARRCRLQP